MERVTRRNYNFLAFLTLLNILNFIDRTLLTSFANFIVPDLALTDTQFGLLVGFAFLIFYSIMGLFMGFLADTVHRPRLIAFGVFLWSLLTMASGAAKGFVTLAIPRMFIGVGESILTPTSISLLADKFPTSRMGFAIGIYYLGIPIGASLALLIAGYFGPTLGWRNCFYILGGIGLIFSLLTLFVKETPRRIASLEQSDTPKISFKDRLNLLIKTLKESPALIYIIIAGVIVHISLGAGSFEQLWLVQERGYERAYIAKLMGWVILVGGIGGNICGGIIGDLFISRFKRPRAMFLFWMGLICAPFTLGMRLVEPGSIWIPVGMFVGAFQVGCFWGPVFASVQEIAPSSIRATVVAFYILCINLIGMGLGATITGISIDFLREANNMNPYSVTLVVLNILTLINLIFFYLAGQKKYIVLNE